MSRFLKVSSLIAQFVQFRSYHSLQLSVMSLSRKAEFGYHTKDCKFIIGVDEAGRGPLAGPVVTAACFIDSCDEHIEGINDSKQTKEEDRDAMYHVLVNHPNVYWEATVVSHSEIDEVNILQATMNGMRRSTEGLVNKLKKVFPTHKFRALVDGNRVPTGMPIDSAFVIKGDSIIFSIAAASIIAKVTRDRLMQQLHEEFPVYNFAQHKGYPTFAHRSLLLQHGPCRVHRASYAPVKLAMQAHGITSLLDLPTAVALKSTATATKTEGKGRQKKVKQAAQADVEEKVVLGKRGGSRGAKKTQKVEEVNENSEVRVTTAKKAAFPGVSLNKSPVLDSSEATPTLRRKALIRKSEIPVQDEESEALLARKSRNKSSHATTAINSTTAAVTTQKAKVSKVISKRVASNSLEISTRASTRASASARNTQISSPSNRSKSSKAATVKAEKQAIKDSVGQKNKNKIIEDGADLIEAPVRKSARLVK